jgi:membrane-bound lytic murein transglycosylase B
LHRITVATLALAVAASGCAGAKSPLETSAPPLARSNANNSPPMARSLSPQPAGFTAWRDGFRSRALQQGISPQIFDAAFQGVGLNSEVIRLDSRQAEFTKPIWEYLDGAASTSRIEQGRARRAQLARPSPPSSAATASTARSCCRSGAWRRTTAPTAARSR